MKLLTKITIWYIAIVAIIMVVTMLIARHNLELENKQAEIERLTDRNNGIAEQIKTGGLSSVHLEGEALTITKWAGPIPSSKTTVEENTVFNKHIGRDEHKITVNSFYQSGSDVYKISSHNYITLIWSSILQSLAMKLLPIILCIVIAASLISRYMLSPFRKTLEALRSFNITERKQLELAPTTTKEFKELNLFVKDMTDKAIAEYATIKEFSENASHELQTPLAVVQSKLELLTGTNIDETQAALMADMQNAIEKLSRINRSLTLLTKLENHEFVPSDIKFCRIVKDQLALYEDRLSLKQITIQQQLDKNIHTHMHPALAEILVGNLLSNAIRHNIEGGAIVVTLTQQQLRISNTGLPPELPTDELFQRFKKSNQSADSTGLGLAIVKQICMASNFTARYEYDGGWHHLMIFFDKNVNRSEVVTAVKEQVEETVLQRS
ncbi:HAMP domain-containing histidine kinase [Lacibacter luteus]|uniref:histidine kinase n=1 Tax=Lacibacter luteus TaxID=2508719 RepID=A0A4Q1CIX0_9BACT|nr:HAMP domain-containing sensor histidine kinase [Lacibacter luteus]RXK60580.1 HAMP domain-containing histidine kinase [Lacibacter luteus]